MNLFNFLYDYEFWVFISVGVLISILQNRIKISKNKIINTLIFAILTGILLATILAILKK